MFGGIVYRPLEGTPLHVLWLRFLLNKGTLIKNARAEGLNARTIVLLIVVGLLVIFMVGNYALYIYAQKNLLPRKKKPMSKKKLKKERLKQGVSAPGE